MKLTHEKMIAVWNEFIIAFPEAIDLEEFDLLREIAYIKKVGPEWCVFGEGGRRMGCYSSKKKAEDRLAQVEMFKHMKSKVSRSGRRECVCENCGNSFTTTKYCDEAKCPACGKRDAHEPDNTEQESAQRNLCECLACGAEFWTNQNCDDARCPQCGDRDAVDV
jgi:DNA-directed RNA polymerase subunit RPC12/RpoP